MIISLSKLDLARIRSALLTIDERIYFHDQFLEHKNMNTMNMNDA